MDFKVVTSNILQRTFRIQYKKETGTCFTIDFENRQYIVTARHLVESIVDQSNVKIMHDSIWKQLRVKLVGHSGGDVDISVLAADRQIFGTAPLALLSADNIDLILSQDVFFLGFPYGLGSEIFSANRNFPLPFVKKAIVSVLGNKDTFLLDGHNNPGFSGGPVVFHPIPDSKILAVAGVVSGYRFEDEPVYQNQEQKASPIGYYEYNTGIIVVSNIKHALDLIRQNPIGVELETGNVENNSPSGLKWR